MRFSPFGRAVYARHRGSGCYNRHDPSGVSSRSVRCRRPLCHPRVGDPLLMSTYPGNPSLAAAVKERVTSTFEQALALFRLGRTDEVAAGCTLILQMDPLFDPAKKLLEKTRNPAAPIDVEALMPSGGNASKDLQEAREAMAARDFQRVVNITTEVLTNDL